jgi:hypothetical protein
MRGGAAYGTNIFGIVPERERISLLQGANYQKIKRAIQQTNL